MRIAALLTVVAAIAAGVWVLVGQITAQMPQVASGPLYQGTGETNLDVQSPDNTLVLELKSGPVVIQMRPDLAPKHVQRIKELVRQGFYDGLTFHRVISGFMAQGGDPDGSGTGGSGVSLPAEFSKVPFKRGIVGMARSQNENSADSQFFIMLDTAGWLRGKYTVWGEVLEGMEHVDAIQKGDDRTGRISGPPDRIVKMTIKGDTD